MGSKTPRPPLVLVFVMVGWMSALLSVFTTSSSSSYGVVVNAEPVQLHGINYNTRSGPDWDPHKCKTHAEVLTDLTLLGRITNRVRVLSLSDCGGGGLVWTVAKELGMQLWLGLWVGPSPDQDFVFEDEVDELVRLLEDMDASDGTVLGITVGSEALYRGDVTEEQIIDNLNRVYTIVKDAGLEDIVPVTICDVAPQYSASANLRAAVNVTFANTFPFWEGIAIDAAVTELDSDLSWLLSLPESQDKPFVLGETGWPSGGYIEGVGVAGPNEQRQYFVDTYCYLHVDKQWDYFWFNGIDDAWRQKQDPNNTIEGTWGFLYSNLTLKDHFADLSFTCSGDGVTYSFMEIDWTIPEGFTNAPAVLDPASCAASINCASLGGNCCPNDDGLYLGCCDALTNETAAPTISPVPTAASPSTPTSGAAPAVPSGDGSSSTTETPTPLLETDSPTVEGTGSTSSPTPGPTTNGDLVVTGSPTGGTGSTTPAPSLIDEGILSDIPSMTPTTSNETLDGDSAPTPQPTIDGFQPSGSALFPTRPPFALSNSTANLSGSSALPARMLSMALIILGGGWMVIM